jgi:hypothetical protein
MLNISLFESVIRNPPIKQIYLNKNEKVNLKKIKRRKNYHDQSCKIVQASFQYLFIAPWLHPHSR